MSSTYRTYRVVKATNVSEILEELKLDVSLVEPVFRDWWLWYLENAFERYVESYSILQKYLDRDSKILEIGSVPYHFTILLKKLGYHVVGVDLDPSRHYELRKKYGLEVLRVDVTREPLPFTGCSFNVVLLMEVLEHIHNPLNVLRESYRVLMDNGVLFISIPAYTLGERLRVLFDKIDTKQLINEYRKYDEIGHYGHVRLYTPNEIRGFLEHIGFREVEIMYRGEATMSWKMKLFSKIIKYMNKELHGQWFSRKYYFIAWK